MRVVISATGRQHGSGTDRYKWVSGLNPEERAAARDGAVVVVEGSPICREVGGAFRTLRRVVYRKPYRYYPRVIRDERTQEAVLAALSV